MSVDAPAGIFPIDICICTYRRFSVGETLQSIAQLTLRPGWKVRVIVADNDETRSARALVENTARNYELDLLYIHAPARNISTARNACLEAATAPFVAFIDDDEVATQGWLAALVAEMEKGNAAAILGPVQAVYGPEAPAWVRAGDFHSIKPVWVGDTIKTGYTSNVLIRKTHPALRGLRFRDELGRSGGEDSVFFSAIYDAGGEIGFAVDAVVKEPVSPERTRFSWLLKRYFRSGQTYGLMLIERRRGNLPYRINHIALAAAKACFCFLAIPLNVRDAERWRYWMLRGTRHVGVVARLLGQREIRQYGHD
jgi:succinoglycan biosynthesis protein ExoM